MKRAWAGISDITEAEGFAIKALSEGAATEDQQRRAWEFILRRACRMHEPSFVMDKDGGALATAFAEGRRSVGIALQTIADLPAAKLKAPTA